MQLKATVTYTVLFTRTNQPSNETNSTKHSLTTNTHFHPTGVNYDELLRLTCECVFVCETFMIANASTQLFSVNV